MASREMTEQENVMHAFLSITSWFNRADRLDVQPSDPVKGNATWKITHTPKDSNEAEEMLLGNLRKGTLTKTVDEGEAVYEMDMYYEKRALKVSAEGWVEVPLPSENLRISAVEGKIFNAIKQNFPEHLMLAGRKISNTGFLIDVVSKQDHSVGTVVLAFNDEGEVEEVRMMKEEAENDLGL